MDEIKDKVEILGKQKDALVAQQKQLLNDKSIVDVKIDEFRKRHKLDSASDMDKQVETLDKQGDELQKVMQSLREEQQALIRKKDSIQYQLATIDDRLTKVKEVEAQHSGEIAKIKQKREEFKKATMELNGLLGEDSKVSSQLMHARRDLLTKNDELAQLQV